MGTNYYLYKKAKYKDPEPDADGYVYDENGYCKWGCGENYASEHVQRLKNGYVWHNKYYPDLTALNYDYYEVYHIGKSSYGWSFLMALYPEKDINSAEDYVALFKNPMNFLEDESGETVNPDYLIKLFKTGNPHQGKLEFRNDQDVTHHTENSWNYDSVISGNDANKGDIIFC